MYEWSEMKGENLRFSPFISLHSYITVFLLFQKNWGWFIGFLNGWLANEGVIKKHVVIGFCILVASI